MSRIFTATLSLLLVFVIGSVSMADNAAKEAKQKVKALAKGAKVVRLADQAQEGAVEVDLFQAIADEQIEVGVVQAKMEGGRLFVKNKTDKPLSVKVPKAFGSKPIMAQDMGMGGGNQFMGNNAGGMGGGMGGMGGGGFMNVPAEAVHAVKYQSVCLEYGKPEPNASVAYEICPIEGCTQKPEVILLVESLNQVDLRSAQFAAWHLNSGVSVQHLASETVRHIDGVVTTNFTQQEVMQGLQLIQAARAAALRQAMPTPSSTESSSMAQ